MRRETQPSSLIPSYGGGEFATFVLSSSVVDSAAGDSSSWGAGKGAFTAVEASAALLMMLVVAQGVGSAAAASAAVSDLTAEFGVVISGGVLVVQVCCTMVS